MVIRKVKALQFGESIMIKERRNKGHQCVALRINLLSSPVGLRQNAALQGTENAKPESEPGSKASVLPKR